MSELLPLSLPGRPTPDELRVVAERAAARVFREDTEAPGFALIDLGPGPNPREFREILVGLVEALGEAYRGRYGLGLAYVSLNRFDQQVTSRPHRDGGPEESVLLLGYEPTRVASRVRLLDDTRCAADRGLALAEFLDRFNPMVGAGASVLEPYATGVEGFDHDRYQILIINNSLSTPDRTPRGLLGVLHQATIEEPLPEFARFVNSLMLRPAGAGEVTTALNLGPYLGSGAAVIA